MATMRPYLLAGKLDDRYTPAMRKLYLKNLNSSATRITKGMMAFSLSQLINFFIRIGLPPLFLTAWGVHAYGDWLVIYSVAAYLSLSNLGGQTYIANRLAQLFAQEKFADYQKVFNSGFSLFVLIASSVFLLLTVFVFFLPISTLLHTQYIDANTVKIVLLILAAEILISLPQGLLIGVYQSIGKLPFAVMLINAMSFLQLLACGIALYLKATPAYVALMHALPLAALTIFALWHAPSQLSFRLFSLKAIEKKLLKSFIRPSINFLAIDLSTAFSVQGIIIILGSVLGSIQVVMFATMRMIINMMKQILGVISNSAWREMTHYDAIKKREKLRLLFRSIIRTSLTAAVIIAIFLYFFAAPLYTLWLHHRVPFHQSLMTLFLLYGIEMVFWTACANLLMSTNRHRILARVYLVTSTLSLIAAYFFGHHYGLHGVIIALLVVDLCLPAWLIPCLVYKYDHHFDFKFFCQELFPVLLAMLLVPLLHITAILIVPGLLYWCYRGLPLDKINANLEATHS